MAKREFDESDVKIRPQRRKPARTKDRPDYSSAQTGLVIETDRGRCQVLIENQIVVNSMKARELGKGSVVVGDLVKVVGDLTGAPGTLARIVNVQERTNSLSRTIDDVANSEKVIVANVDQMGIVVAAANPEPKLGLVDRALVVAFDQGIEPIIIFTKCDLANPDQFLKNYEELGVNFFKINKESDLQPLLEKLKSKKTVLFGHSGVGKSTLVNKLAGINIRSTGSVNEVTGRGRHTSSNALAINLDYQGISDQTWIIDTPGVRSFGISHLNPTRVYQAFPEFAKLIARCPKNCSHNEVSCELNLVVENNNFHQFSRLNSLRRLLNN